MNDLLNRTHLLELIDKYLSGQASKEEKDFLEAYYDYFEKEEAILEKATAQQKEQLRQQMLSAILKEIGQPKPVEAPRTHNPSRPTRIHPIRRKQNPWSIVAVAATILLAVAATLWMRPEWVTDTPQQELAIDQSGEFVGKQFINLPDGSTVFLNEGSELRYEASFGEEIREVALTGEAYFDVAHNPDKPFMVRTGEVNTRVLGTAFNVQAFDGEEVVVTVTRGKVEVGNKEQVFDYLLPDEQMVVHTVSGSFEKKNINSQEVSEWKEQFFVLNNTTIAEAAEKIGERYEVEVSLDNTAIESCRITATFAEGEDLEEVLAVLTGIIQAEYTITAEKDKVTIEGGRCG